MDVPEGEYIVFEHGPFDFETENASVEAKIEQAMKEKPFSKITINDISDAAGVNRSTWFRNFDTKNDALTFKLPK